MAKYASNSNDDGDDVDPTDYTAVQRSMVSSNFDITDYAAKEPKPAPRPPTAVRIIPRNPTRHRRGRSSPHPFPATRPTRGTGS